MKSIMLLAVALLALTPCQTMAQARMVGQGIISNDGVFGATFYNQDREVFFVDSRKGRDTLRIMYSQQQNGVWQKPVAAPFASAYKDIDPVLSGDGKRLFFNSNRPLTGQTAKKDFDIWYVDKIGNGWSAPNRLSSLINTDSTSEFYASSARNGNLYFTSTRADGYGQADIYVARYRNGQYEKPENIGSRINTDQSESNPFIAPNEQFLLFFSTRPGGFGDSDLYISYRQNNTWTTPENVGSMVNTAVGEFCPSVSADGKQLYFSRIVRNATKAIESENIYVIETKYLPIPAKLLRF